MARGGGPPQLNTGLNVEARWSALHGHPEEDKQRGHRMDEEGVLHLSCPSMAREGCEIPVLNRNDAVGGRLVEECFQHGCCPRSGSLGRACFHAKPDF